MKMTLRIIKEDYFYDSVEEKRLHIENMESQGWSCIVERNHEGFCMAEFEKSEIK